MRSPAAYTSVRAATRPYSSVGTKPCSSCGNPSRRGPSSRGSATTASAVTALPPLRAGASRPRTQRVALRSGGRSRASRAAERSPRSPSLPNRSSGCSSGVTRVTRRASGARRGTRTSVARARRAAAARSSRPGRRRRAVADRGWSPARADAPALRCLAWTPRNVSALGQREAGRLPSARTRTSYTTELPSARCALLLRLHCRRAHPGRSSGAGGLDEPRERKPSHLADLERLGYGQRPVDELVSGAINSTETQLRRERLQRERSLQAGDSGAGDDDVPATVVHAGDARTASAIRHPKQLRIERLPQHLDTARRVATRQPCSALIRPIDAVVVGL